MQVEQVARDVGRHEGDVGVFGQVAGNVHGGLQLLDFDLGCAELGHSLVDESGGVGLGLGSDDLGSLQLLISLHDKLLHFRQLLLHSLPLNCPRVLRTEPQMHKTHIRHNHVELLRLGVESVPDFLADDLSGFEQLVGVI